MRSFGVLGPFAGGVLVALFAGACNSPASLELAPDGGDSGGSGRSPADGAEGSATMDAADAACGTIPTPNAWAQWIMPNPVRSGLPNAASYTVSDSGNQVTDDVTGLVWQRNVDARSYTWDEAQQFCACLTVDGEGGWRLPSRIELASIADWTITRPSIDNSAFPSTPSESFWASSVLTGDPDLGWLVTFERSFTTYSDKGYTYRARCTRGGAEAPTSERYTISNGTVYDTQTKLTWEQATSSSTWADATAYCSGLLLNGGGWRLPAIGELQTLVDERSNPSIDGAVFPMTPSDYFWSSSVVVDDPTRAWTCFFANGSTYSFVFTKLESVRCVR